MLCSVLKHAGSGRVRKKCRGTRLGDVVDCPSYFLSALPLPKYFTAEQSTVEASFVLNNPIISPHIRLNFETTVFFFKSVKVALAVLSVFSDKAR